MGNIYLRDAGDHFLSRAPASPRFHPSSPASMRATHPPQAPSSAHRRRPPAPPTRSAARLVRGQQDAFRARAHHKHGLRRAATRAGSRMAHRCGGAHQLSRVRPRPKLGRGRPPRVSMWRRPGLRQAARACVRPPAPSDPALGWPRREGVHPGDSKCRMTVSARPQAEAGILLRRRWT